MLPRCTILEAASQGTLYELHPSTTQERGSPKACSREALSLVWADPKIKTISTETLK